MSDQRDDDLTMLQYFWSEKGDMKRYCRYAECIDNFPLVKQAELNMQLATLALDAALDAEG